MRSEVMRIMLRMTTWDEVDVDSMWCWVTNDEIVTGDRVFEMGEMRRMQVWMEERFGSDEGCWNAMQQAMEMMVRGKPRAWRWKAVIAVGMELGGEEKEAVFREAMLMIGEGRIQRALIKDEEEEAKGGGGQGSEDVMIT